MPNLLQILPLMSVKQLLLLTKAKFLGVLILHQPISTSEYFLYIGKEEPCSQSPVWFLHYTRPRLPLIPGWFILLQNQADYHCPSPHSTVWNQQSDESGESRNQWNELNYQRTCGLWDGLFSQGPLFSVLIRETTAWWGWRSTGLQMAQVPILLTVTRPYSKSD